MMVTFVLSLSHSPSLHPYLPTNQPISLSVLNGSQGSKRTTWKGPMTMETFPHLADLGKIKGVTDFLGPCPPIPKQL